MAQQKIFLRILSQSAGSGSLYFGQIRFGINTRFRIRSADKINFNTFFFVRSDFFYFILVVGGPRGQGRFFRGFGSGFLSRARIRSIFIRIRSPVFVHVGGPAVTISCISTIAVLYTIRNVGKKERKESVRKKLLGYFKKSASCKLE